MIRRGTARHKNRRSAKPSDKQVLVSIPRYIQYGIRALFSLILFVVIGIFVAIKMFPEVLFGISQPTNLVIIERNSAVKTSFYFVHINKDSKLNRVFTLASTELHTQEAEKLRTLIQNVSPDQAVSQQLYSLVSQTSGVVVDDIFVFTQNDGESTLQQLLLFGAQSSDFSWLDRARFFGYYVLLDKAVAKEEVLFRDISQLLSDNQSLWDANDPMACPIAIINATNVQGLAQTYSNVLEESGGYVVRLSSMPAEKQESTLLLDDTKGECGQMIDRIKKMFPVLPNVEKSSPLNTELRAGIILYLGEDAAL